MIAETLVAALEKEGLQLKAEGEKLKLQAPASKVPDAEIIAELRQNKAAVLAYLRGRDLLLSSPMPVLGKAEKLENWPAESLDAVRRFAQPHAKLFRLLGHKVRTPAGPGTLLQVFAERVTVLLDRDLKKCSWFSPSEIQPVSRDWLT